MTGSVKEMPLECEVGDWVLATGSYLEEEWADGKKHDDAETEVTYPDDPEVDRRDLFKRVASYGGEGGAAWARIR